MESFKYSLDKSSKKHICPSCDKKTFVFYVNTETGGYLTTDYGRCDREQNCSYHKAPAKGKKAFLIPFLSLVSITDKAYKFTDANGVISIIPKTQILERNKGGCYVTEWYLKNSSINYLSNGSKYFNSYDVVIVNELIDVKKPDVLPPSFHSLSMLDEMYNDKPIEDNLSMFLKLIFTKDQVDEAIQRYFITGTNHFWNNATVFWQIDNKERIRGAKIMLYDKHKGKRIKKPYNHINWLHKAINESDFKLSQCLYGLHLINDDFYNNIAIVESEKTAIIMSIILPEFIWIATGSKSNFKDELLKPLKNKKCFAFPDKGEFTNWNNTASDLNGKGYKIAVSDLLEKTSFSNGFDLADYYLKNKEK